MHRILSWLTIGVVAALILAGCANSPARRLLDFPKATSEPAASPTTQPAANVPPTDVPPTSAPPTDVPATNVPVTQTTVPATKTAVPATANTASQSAIEVAIKDVIQKANAQQIEAFTKHDPSPMKPTATDSYYAKLLQINQDLQSGGVADIKLVDLQWGPIAVKSPTAAEATTVETWSTSYNDGSTDQSSDRNIYSLVLDNGVWKIADDVHPDAGLGNTPPGADPSAVDPNTIPPLPRIRIGPGESRNWSGYAATGGKYTSVTGTWIVPKPSASRITTTAATWVGIGGTQSHDLIQAGTEETTSTAGQVRYNAWVETLPASSRRVSLRVTAGDSVTVTITQKKTGTWLITMVDNTTGQKYETTEQYNSSLSSAEWVEEAPSGGRRVLPLENFGAIHFTASSAVKDGKKNSLSQLGAKPISMIDGFGGVIASPSSISTDGSGFTITRNGARSPTGPALPRFGLESRGLAA